MRIKMQCPDCGKWFTLELAVKESRSRDARQRGGTADERREGVTPIPVAEPGNDRDSRAVSGAGGLQARTLSGEHREHREARTTAWPLPMVPILVVVAAALAWFFLLGPAAERPRESVVAEMTEEPVLETMPEDRLSTGQKAAATGVDDARAGEQAAPVSQPEATDETRADGTGEGAMADDVQTGPLEAVPGEASAIAAEGEQRDPVPGSLELELLATERCWVRVVVDGSETYDLTLHAGERRAWRGNTRFELDIGSGEDVQLFLNGEPLGRAGSGSRVVEGLVLTSDAVNGSD